MCGSGNEHMNKYKYTQETRRPLDAPVGLQDYSSRTPGISSSTLHDNSWNLLKSNLKHSRAPCENKIKISSRETFKCELI